MEKINIYDKNKRLLDKITDRHNIIDNEYELCVHCFIMDENGKILIQKRSMNKKYQPGKWTVCGGGVELGEEVHAAAIREVKEEIGINILEENLEFILSIKRNEFFLDVYLARQNYDINEIKIDKNELSEVKAVTIEELKNMIENNEISNNIKIYFDTFINLI